ncbi:type II toxin-antitoxin system RelE family toxin [Lactiplantibacillus modestisalitolerans]|uniref:Type II toxin-antitoxin system RelE/ParE family toxin n=1 Tax=Lactiplantibacillus modestisalitolerans TaxID=1457219 RepID=A0ABV5WR12_9LACO|nr:type II toxin-antitoxin system RelE/ParE family toxin [Lactiplantibacillus modestisalitolerans]
MKYTWSFNQKTFKDFQKNLDKAVQIRIFKWLDKHIEGADDPRIWGKALEGEYGTLWRYRVGSYRIIADIQDGIFTVEVVKVGKRNDVYKRK